MASLSVTAIPKILALLLLVCLTRVAAGSCLSYGHSCWGGHGKRSASIHHTFNPSNNEKRNDDWYFSKFLKILKEKPADSSTIYNAYLKDMGILEKLIKNGHLKHTNGEPVEDAILRDQDVVNLANETEEPENNDMETDALFIPEEEDLMWNSKFHTMQRMVDKARKTTG